MDPRETLWITKIQDERDALRAENTRLTQRVAYLEALCDRFQKQRDAALGEPAKVNP